MSNLAPHPDEVETADGTVTTAPTGAGPVRRPADDVPHPLGDGRALLEPREVPLGGPRAMLVRRTLPHRDIRTIGAWCFVDHFGPTRGGPAMRVPPHPHTGLQTVTWLLEGEVEHRDSVGSLQRVRPGELNIMTSGRGIAHSEDTVRAGVTADGVADEPADQPADQPADGGPAPAIHGVQLWVALPDVARHQDPHFEHHDDLPVLDLPGARATVVVGQLDGARSAAAAYSPLLGVEVVLAPEADVSLPLEPEFEHGVLAVEGTPVVDGVPVAPSSLLHLDRGRRDLRLAGPGRLLLLGGPPFEEELVMWWNFIGRDHDEIVRAREDWESGRRFGTVDHPAGPLHAPALPTTRLRARPGRRH